MKQYIKHNEWNIIEEGLIPEYNKISESIFSLGNGKIGHRGNFEEYYSGDTLRGNYISGVYYPDKTKVGWWKNGYPEYFAKVLNAPDWIGIKIEIDSQKLDLNTCKITDFTRMLNMQHGFFQKHYIAEFADGKKIEVNSIRFLSIVNDELGVIRFSVKPINFSGIINVVADIDADISNQDSNYDEKFWIEIEKSGSNAYIISETKKTNFRVCTAMKIQCFQNKKIIENINPEIIKKEKYISHNFNLSVIQDQETTIVKYGAIASSLYYNNAYLVEAAHKVLAYAEQKGFDALFQEQNTAWENKWEESDIIIEGDVAAQQGIRFNIFQLNQTYTGTDERLNIGPKGFTGEKYGGSTYWDTEAYCLPFYLSTADNKVARNLLKYRYKHLPKAIENAEKLGFKNGAALFPMVTMNGEECHNEWEITFEEIHRNGAIAFAIYDYVRYSGDKEYYVKYGLEVLMAISRFWVQRIHFSEDKQKYVMLGVTGPNEYENNINNNWYTSKMACWTMEFTSDIVNYVKTANPQHYSEIVSKTNFNEKIETANWNNIVEKMYFAFDEKRQIFLQQDGFLDKDIKPASSINSSERPIHQHWSWDRILRSCYIKQADVLQGLYVFEEKFDVETIRRNFDFYEPITVHESSLSSCVHSILAAKVGYFEKAYNFYLSASRLDLDDYNNDTKDGLHITSMGGTWMSVVYGFGGMRVRNEKLSFSPFVPKHWKSFSFKIKFRQHLLKITMSSDKIQIYNESDTSLHITLYNNEYTINSKDILIEKTI